jgi:hypothetical protein
MSVQSDNQAAVETLDGDAALPVVSGRIRRWLSLLGKVLLGVWRGWPIWAQGFAALVTIAVLLGLVYGSKTALAPAPNPTPTSTSPTGPSAPSSTTPTTTQGSTTTTESAGTSRYLDELKAPSSEHFGTGLGTIDGTSYQQSLRQIYTCCEKSLWESFPIPAGFSHFYASIGLETGGTYTAESPTILFEVDTGNANHRVVQATMSYNEPAESIEADVAGEHEIVLRTTIASTEGCDTCEADAVWGNARFTH